MKYLTLVIFLTSMCVFAENIQVYDSSLGKTISQEELIANISDSKVIHVGETHDSAVNHAFQSLIIANLATDKSAVGFEMLEKPYQKSLDDYLAGILTEKDFIEKTWLPSWGFDFELYRPIFTTIFEKELGGVALNVPREINKKIMKGGLESLTDDERAQLPEYLYLEGTQKYKEWFYETAKEMHPNMPEPMLKKFYLAQMIWNETMGDMVAKSLSQYDKTFVVAGNGHVIFNDGIRWSVAQRLPSLKQSTIYQYDTDDLSIINYEELKEFGDFIVVHEVK